jgi:uncharacterized membrane protein (UPF0127 family)
MCRSQLDDDRGMLLSYPAAGELGIWMKNMRLGLDILFLDGEGRILSIEASVPPCTASPCPIYRSSPEARHALELKGGAAETLGLTPGQRLRLPRFVCRSPVPWAKEAHSVSGAGRWRPAAAPLRPRSGLLQARHVI